MIAAERDKGGVYSLEAVVREYLQNPCFAGSGGFSSVWTTIIWRMPSIARWVQLDLLHGCHPASISHGTPSCSKDPKISKHHQESNYTQTPEIHGNSTSIHPTKQENHGNRSPKTWKIDFKIYILTSPSKVASHRARALSSTPSDLTGLQQVCCSSPLASLIVPW